MAAWTIFHVHHNHNRWQQEVKCEWHIRCVDQQWGQSCCWRWWSMGIEYGMYVSVLVATGPIVLEVVSLHPGWFWQAMVGPVFSRHLEGLEVEGWFTAEVWQRGAISRCQLVDKKKESMHWWNMEFCQDLVLYRITLLLLLRGLFYFWTQVLNFDVRPVLYHLCNGNTVINTSNHLACSREMC